MLDLVGYLLVASLFYKLPFANFTMERTLFSRGEIIQLNAPPIYTIANCFLNSQRVTSGIIPRALHFVSNDQVGYRPSRFSYLYVDTGQDEQQRQQHGHCRLSRSAMSPSQIIVNT